MAKSTANSKFLSLILRHQPQLIGLELDAQGWTNIDELLQQLEKHQRPLSHDTLKALVHNCPKQRFAISPDGLRIRANQGHSIPIELGYSPCDPPETLYHGTAQRNLQSILSQGLLKGKRHHVHLSEQEKTALQVGARYGKPVLLLIDAASMHKDGYTFYKSTNGVWLTEAVPPNYLLLS